MNDSIVLSRLPFFVVTESLPHFDVACGVCAAGFHYAAWTIRFGLGGRGGIWFLGGVVASASGDGECGDEGDACDDS